MVSPDEARAWVELPRGTGWGDTRLAIGAFKALGYVCEEVRGERVFIRLAGGKLETSALWVMPLFAAVRIRFIAATRSAGCVAT